LARIRFIPSPSIPCLRNTILDGTRRRIIGIEKTVPGPAAGRRVDIPLLALNLFLLCLTAAAIYVSDAHYRRRSAEAALGDNRFLTTEWRILQELKDKTDRVLRDKDREIENLRLRYRTLQRQKASTALLEALEAELLRAESERQAILAARFSPASFSAGSEAVPAPGAPASSAPAARASEGAVAELLRDRIRKLEEEAAANRRDAEARMSELERLRGDLTAARPPEGTGNGTAYPESGTAEMPVKSGMEDALLALLESGRDSLAGTDPVLSLADLRTRTLLRAIVRTPAIRAEYPDLADSLDRYFDLYGTAERIRGRREAYEEALSAARALLGK
jgi:hypothetical protein